MAGFQTEEVSVLLREVFTSAPTAFTEARSKITAGITPQMANMEKFRVGNL